MGTRKERLSFSLGALQANVFFFQPSTRPEKYRPKIQKRPKTQHSHSRTHALHSRQRLLGSSAPLLRSYETPLSARLLSAPLLRSKLFTEASSRALGWVVSSWVARWVEIGGWGEAKSGLKVASAVFGDLGRKKKTFAFGCAWLSRDCKGRAFQSCLFFHPHSLCNLSLSSLLLRNLRRV
jgi:hypothetical protein